ncbi:MORN repeat-containing protein [Viscerimonas tarda]
MSESKTNGKLVLNNGHCVYEGEILDGKATGKGFLRWDDGENWEGTFINGVPNGQCKRFWDDGMYVEGVFENAQPVGDVKLYQPNVGLFEGPLNGRGKCKMTYPDGSYYIGECVDKQPDGWGKKVQPGLSEREGEWRGGEPHGYSINKVSDAFAAQVGEQTGWTGEGVITQGVQRQWWIKHTNGKPEVIRARDNFDIPQEDLPLSINARLFLGFIEMYIENDEGKLGVDFATILYPESNKFGYLLTQPIEKKAEAYYNWLVEKRNVAKSEKEYTALAKKFSDISEYKDSFALTNKCKLASTYARNHQYADKSIIHIARTFHMASRSGKEKIMSDNKLMDKLVAGYNERCKEMESLDSKIKESKSEIDDLAKKIKDWQNSYDNYLRILKGAPYGSLQYEMADIAIKKLLPEITNMQYRHDDLVKEHNNLVKEHDSLKDKFGNISSLSVEAKGDTYYRWLVEDFDAAKSEEEYTALAKKFSDISEYKDCAALADKCKQRVIK